ncbi:MAG: hypothetical protein LRZ85_01400 [Alphaproteobacteria bacterium]|nr:hypothetical protein [Alphaproteobacteria bacterium]
MKAIILGAAVLAVIGGGGFGAYSYFMKTAEAAPLAGEHDAAAAEEHAAAEAPAMIRLIHCRWLSLAPCWCR